MVGQN